ncbi:hypothetical protein BDR04DRAFT_771097 [Suillus decipiens]|nr:hypothetical protein BDR04DRAFT_771097 [Suillus decipiens]
MTIYRLSPKKSRLFGVVRRRFLQCCFSSIVMSPCSPISFTCSAISCPFQTSCSKYLLANQVLLVSQQVFICIILFLRTYALYGCSRRLLKWMAIIGLTLIAGALAGSFGNDSDSVTDGDCHEIYTTVTSIRHGIAWLAMFIFELIIFVLTVFKTCKTRGLPRFFEISRTDILDIIFHDGVMYFAGMTLVNLPNILTYFCGSDVTRGSLSTITSWWVDNAIDTERS